MPLTQNELQEYAIHRLFNKHKIKTFSITSLPPAIKNHLGSGLDAIFKAWMRDGFLIDLYHDNLYEYTQVGINRYRNLRRSYRHQQLEVIAFWVLVGCGLISAGGVVANLKSCPKASKSPQSTQAPAQDTIQMRQTTPISHTTVPIQDSPKKKAKWLHSFSF